MGQVDDQIKIFKIKTVPLVILTKDKTPKKIKFTRVLHTPKISYNLVLNRRLRAHKYYFYKGDDMI